jgi:hypothetical protein
MSYPLTDLLASLVQGIVDFLQIDRGRDVEGVELSHGHYSRVESTLVAERSGLPLVLVVDDYQDAREDVTPSRSGASRLQCRRGRDRR